MNKKNKVVLTMGTVAAVVIPTAIVATSVGSKVNTINNIKGKSLYSEYSNNLTLFNDLSENARPLLQGKNKSITSGFKGQLFEDSKGNIWALSVDNPLQVLKHGESEWKDAKHGNRIKNGLKAKIYEDSKGNLWTISSSGIQVLRVSEGKTEWDSNFVGNRISDGTGGQILEDAQGNMWAIADNTSLQVLKKGSQTWEIARNGNKLLYNNDDSKLFEDSKGNLWAMSFGHELQVLRAGSSYWENANPSGRDETASAGTTTNYGFNSGGKIFEDSKGNIWVGGSNYPLNVLRSGKKTWEIVGGATSPVIWNSEGLIIHEDSKGNIWAVGNSSWLKVLKKGHNTWEQAGHGSDIASGDSGNMIEDSEGNLWIMGGSSPLQVLRHNASQWDYAGNGNKINSYNLGSILQDSHGNIWTMGREIPLQVLRKGKTKWVDRTSEKNIISLANKEQESIKNKILPSGLKGAENKAKSLQKTSEEIKELIANKPNKFKDILNINVSDLGPNTSVKKINFDAMDGEIGLQVETLTVSASLPTKKFDFKIKTLSEKEVLDLRNGNLQTKEQKSIVSKIKDFDTKQVSAKAKETKKTAEEIAKLINDDALKLKKILGLDVDKFVEGTTSAINKIKLTSKDGEIQLSLTVYTPGVEQQYINVPMGSTIETLTDKEVENLNKKSNLGGIIGGTIGGLIILGGISILAFKVWKQIQKRRRDKFQNKLDSNINKK